MDAAILWVVAGGLLEPVWVVCLRRYDDTRSLLWLAATVFFAILSPVVMGVGMESMSVGTAYAVWTGIGAVCTMAVGALVYKERVGALRMACVGLILVGVVGLELAMEAGL